MKNECVYRGDPIQAPEGEVLACQVHGRCLPSGESPTVACCEGCRERLLIDDPRFADRWLDPLEILARDGSPTTVLRGMLAGRSAFLLCGGPSANALPLESLARRGTWTMAVNNAAGHPRVRPQAFVCADPPMKFSHSIWLDPAVSKFVPTPKLLCKGRRNIRVKQPDGTFEVLNLRTGDCPNVWAFRREGYMFPDDRFFLGTGACWGNHDAGVARTGEPKTVCTMLLAFRLMRWLGCRRLYLLGVDFRMTPSAGYSFAQGRDQGACDSNNAQFVVVNDWLVRMQAAGTFDRFGMPVYNCYAESGLRAFPHVPFADALEDVCRGVEQVPDLIGWYDTR